ncbi:MAG TPA: hypothetical protein VFF26_14945 [Gallionella sp.]|nr:hypothetical protein [Gallionella sp.]
MNIGSVAQTYGVAQTPTVSRSASGAREPDSSDSKGSTDTVQFSSQGKTLAELPPLLLPTRENVQKLSNELSADLKNLFNGAGIDPKPEVEFEVDSYTGKVSVKNNRPDAQKIAELIKNNPDIEMKIHNVAALSSHVVAMGPAMEADAAYRAANSEAEIRNVVAKYASVYSGYVKVTDFSLSFNGSDLQVNADGAPWLSTRG